MTQMNPYGGTGQQSPEGFTPQQQQQPQPGWGAVAAQQPVYAFQQAPPGYQQAAPQAFQQAPPMYQQAPPAYQPWGAGQVAQAPHPIGAFGQHHVLPLSVQPAQSRRTPIAAAIVALLLLVGGVVVSGVLSGNSDPPAAAATPAAKKPAAGVATPPSDAAVPAAPKPNPPAKKPAPKPGAAPRGGTWVAVTAANSGTLGAPYKIAAPRDHDFERGEIGDVGEEAEHIDLYMTDGAQTQQLFVLSMPGAPDLADGALPPALLRQVRQSGMSSAKSARSLPGTSVAAVAGFRATGFDYTQRDEDGTLQRVRMLFFAHQGTVYAVGWVAEAEGFAGTVSTFQHIVGTMTFTGERSTEAPSDSTET